MTPDELTLIGKYLYGEFWQSSLAEDLNINTRTIRRWLTGGIIIKESIETEIWQLVCRKYHLGTIVKEIFNKYSKL